VKEEHRGIVKGNGKEDFIFKGLGSFRDPTVQIAYEYVQILREE
jgi:hypothetical protein